MKHRFLSVCLLLSLAAALALPASALLLSGDGSLSVAAFAKSTMPGQVLAFSADDFRVEGEGNADLDAIVLTSLPEPGAGSLRLGDAELAVGDTVSMDAVAGMRFYPFFAAVVSNSSFTFIPVFSDGVAGEDVTVSLYLLKEENSAPTAGDQEICTYKNVAVTGKFSAADPDGDALSFRLVKKPARGRVDIAEDGSGTFTYTPYENKTGKDSFTYVVEDSVGNVSPEATVKVVISKAKTKVVYGDMTGHPANKAAIRLAEEGVLVGERMDGVYYFQPDLPVSRDQFVVMAMSAAGLSALDGVTATGFADDANIPAWAKGYVSAALMSGLVQGSANSKGEICFRTGAAITKAEATVLVDRILRVAETEDAQTLSAQAVPAWAYSSAVKLCSVSVIPDAEGMTREMTRADAAQMLCAMLEYRDSQKTGWFG